MPNVDYLSGFSSEIRTKAHALRDSGQLIAHLEARYPEPHQVSNNALLYTYVQQLKRHHMKSSPPLGKVRYCEKIATVHRAFGLHTFAIRLQGAKLKRKNELRVGAIFKELPAPFLRMVVVHELAHLRHKDHDRAFYRLCQHMEPDYGQLEMDLRLYLFARGGPKPSGA